MRRIALSLMFALSLPVAFAAAQDAAHGHTEVSNGDEAVVEANGEHGAAHEEHAPGGMNKEFYWAVLNFVVLVFLIVKYGGPKISEFLAERRSGVAQALEEAQKLKAEAEKRATEYKERLARLDAELDAIRQEMVKAGEAERDRIVAEAEKKAARMRRETEFLIEQRMKQLREEVTREAIESAIDTAEKVLTEKTTAEDQQRISRAYLAKLAEVAKEGRA